MSSSRARKYYSTVDEDDYLRHQSPEPQPFGGHEWPTRAPGLWPGQVRRSPASDEHSVALRYDLDEPITDPTVGRALVALSTEPEVLSALLLQSDVPSAPAGRMPANVLTQTVTFVEPIDLSTGFGLTLTPTYAGHGRAHGSGQVVTDVGSPACDVLDDRAASRTAPVVVASLPQDWMPGCAPRVSG